MAINLTVNGVVYRYPEQNDVNWGQVTTNWAQAVTVGMLQKSGGSFPLTADVDFGANFGLVSSYYTSRSSDAAQSGSLRLSATDFIAFRNQLNSDDLEIGVNSSDELTFNGSILLSTATTSLTNSNIASNAAISFSKMAALTANTVPLADASGVIISSAVSSTTLGFLDATSSIQTQLDSKLNLAGGTMVGPLILPGIPTLSNEAATKQYVDNAMLGISPKAPAEVATTGNITLSGEQTIDGVLTSSSRVLVKNQTLPEENGIYVSGSGAWTRSTDLDVWSEAIQAYVLVTQGTSNIGSAFLSTAVAGGTIGVTPLIWNQFSSSTQYTADGQGIELTGTTFSLELDGTTLTKSVSGLRVNSTIISDINSKLTNPLTTTGDLIYSSSGATGSRLGVGTSGQFLMVSGGLPSWQTVNLNPNPATGSITGNVSLLSSDTNKIFFVDTSSPRNITLPTPAAGLNFYLKDSTGQANTNNISLIRAASEQIEGVAATKLLQTNWGSWRIISDGTNWFLI